MSMALVLNPSHPRAQRAHDELRRQVPLTTYMTTPEEPGGQQAKQALTDGCTSMVVAGGDGTARTVAGVLAGTGMPLGIVPTGTACIYARNLRLSRGRRGIAQAVRGQPRHMDIGWARLDGGSWQPFLVAAGMGRDARAIASVSKHSKQHLGWLAYALAGFRCIPQPPLTLAVNQQAGAAWSVLVGNVGMLPIGTIFPRARPDDGWLHVLRIWPRRAGEWAGVFARGLLRDPRPTRHLARWESRRLEIVSEQPEAVHLDGDPQAPARLLELAIQPGALLVRS